jgi:hypothetical protein
MLAEMAESGTIRPTTGHSRRGSFFLTIPAYLVPLWLIRVGRGRAAVVYIALAESSVQKPVAAGSVETKRSFRTLTWQNKLHRVGGAAHPHSSEPPTMKRVGL